MKQSKNTKKQANVVALEVNAPDKWAKQFKWILFVVAFLLYANTTQNDYNMDDILVTQNHRLTSQGIEAIGEIFSSPYYQDDMGYAYGYRPMVHVSYAIEHTFFGENPKVGHLINTLLFAFSCLLLFKFLYRLNKNDLSLWIVISTLLFAVHPVHTEVVASLKNRDELLAFLFTISAGISMLKFMDKEKWTSLFWGLVFFSAAMLSKKSIFPMLFILTFGWALLHELNFKRFIIFIGVLAIPSVLVASDMNTTKMIPLITAVFLFVGLIYALFVAKIKFNKAFFYSKATIVAIPTLLVLLAFYDYSVFYPILALIFFAYTITKEKEFTLYVIPVALLLFFSVDFNKFIFFALIITSIYYLFELFKDKEKLFYFLIATLCMGAGLSLYDGNYSFLHVIPAFIFIFWAVRKFPIILLSIIIVTAFVLIYFFNIGQIVTFFLFALPSISILLHKYLPRIAVISFLFIGSSIVLFSDSYEDINFQEIAHKYTPETSENKIQEVMAKTHTNENTGFLKEGRSLQPIENTLVLPHTKSETIATGFATLGEYFRLMIYPNELSFYYGYAKTKTENLSSAWVWISIFVHLALIVIGLIFMRKKPIITWGVFWYFGSILLFSNWVELVAGMVGERLAFTASFGFCLLIGGLVSLIAKDFNLKKPKAIEWSLIVVLAVLSVRTIVRNGDWKDQRTLFLHDVKHLQNSAQVNNLVANSLMEYASRNPNISQSEKIELARQAVTYYDKAIDVWNGFFNAAFDKGRVGMFMGDTTIAIAGFEKAIEIGNPDFLFPYYNLQDIYLNQRKLDKYMDINRKLLVLDSINPKIYSHLANGYFMTNQLDSTEYILKIGSEKFPNDEGLKLNLQEVQAKRLRE
ncbi:MAG TPA: glycosyltransferase family 39 protein [Crocinitomicaceae bacterium]|nr:glycosyltransferase family 39 protein [Crocinitomicaceae bacterium]